MKNLLNFNQSLKLFPKIYSKNLNLTQLDKEIIFNKPGKNTTCNKLRILMPSLNSTHSTISTTSLIKSIQNMYKLKCEI